MGRRMTQTLCCHRWPKAPSDARRGPPPSNSNPNYAELLQEIAEPLGRVPRSITDEHVFNRVVNVEVYAQWSLCGVYAGDELLEEESSPCFFGNE